MTQTVLGAAAVPMSWQDLLDLGWGNIVYFAVVGLVVLAFKQGWIGIITFNKFDRGAREFLGKPRKILGRGAHPYIKGLSNMRRVSVANTLIDVAGRVTIKGRVFEYKLSFLVAVIDEMDHILTAIYNTFDETKTDAFNAQRQAYIIRRIAATVRVLIEDDHVEFKDLTVEKITDKCSADLIKFAGSQINELTGNECAPVDAQIIADKMGEDTLIPGVVVGTPDIIGAAPYAA